MRRSTCAANRTRSPLRRSWEHVRITTNRSPQTRLPSAGVNGAEFLRRARRYARRNRQEFRFDKGAGKGSHGKLYIGGGRTVVKHGEISKGMLRSMLRQLGIEHEDF